MLLLLEVSEDVCRRGPKRASQPETTEQEVAQQPTATVSPGGCGLLPPAGYYVEASGNFTRIFFTSLHPV